MNKSNFGLIINRQAALDWSCTFEEKSMQFVLLTCEFIICKMFVCVCPFVCETVGKTLPYKNMVYNLFNILRVRQIIL